MDMCPNIEWRKRTAKKSDLGDVPRISQAPESNVLVVDAGSMLRVEEESHSTRVSAKADVAIAIAITMADGVMESRRSTAINERAGLVGRCA
ncbi:hypothetical protein ACLX1H_011226 [Fusarium chlamydosporum]